MISGFGKFMVKDKKARRGRNPQTRADLQLRARRVVVFKTSGVLRRRINEAAGLDSGVACISLPGHHKGLFVALLPQTGL